MKNTITRKNVGYFGCLYAGYLKAYYPEAYEKFIAREDHMELLKKYQACCQDQMFLLLELFRKDIGIVSRKELEPGLQQDYYDMAVAKIKKMIFAGLVDLLAEVNWMSE